MQILGEIIAINLKRNLVTIIPEGGLVYTDFIDTYYVEIKDENLLKKKCNEYLENFNNAYPNSK